MLESIRGTLALLDPRSRRILWLLVLVQVTLALLDMLGVLLFGVVAALSASAVSGEEPAFIGGLLELVGLDRSDEISLAIMLAVVAGLLLVVKSITSFLLIRRTYRFLAKRQAIISSRLASRLLSRPLLDVQRRSSQQTAYALVQGANAATIGVLGSAVVVASEVAVLFLLMIGLLAVDAVIALFTVLFFSLIAWALYRIFGNRARRLGQQLSASEIASITAAQNAVQTYREVSVTGRRGIIVEKFQHLRWQAAHVQADIQIMAQIPKYVFEITLIVGGGLLAFSQFLTRDVVAAVAVIVVFLTAATRILPSLSRLQGAVLAIKSSSGVAAPTLELAAEFPEDGDAAVTDRQLRDRVTIGIREGYAGFVPDIELIDVTLSYPGADAPALTRISLRVLPGESLALVGPTGAGKSTIADVILGVLAPDQGTVTLSGVDPSAAAQQWPGAIAYVPQDISVLEGTIRENVALGLPLEIVEDDLAWEALERAHLADVVREEHEGLDTIVGENGVRLSGGQRQRLGLARAFYARPRLIVLDEATSALDAETERAVSEALNELIGEVTLVIVAHRLVTIRHCTSVAYVEDGVLRSQGTFEDVRLSEPNFDRQAHLLGL